jgi:hypothetical protein
MTLRLEVQLHVDSATKLGIEMDVDSLKSTLSKNIIIHNEI